jgi:hypothetical protein
MGNSPDDGWIQRVTIEIPGPVASQQAWGDFKNAVAAVLQQFEVTVRAQIVEIANIKKPSAAGVPEDGDGVIQGPP